MNPNQKKKHYHTPLASIMFLIVAAIVTFPLSARATTIQITDLGPLKDGITPISLSSPEGWTVLGTATIFDTYDPISGNGRYQKVTIDIDLSYDIEGSLDPIITHYNHTADPALLTNGYSTDIDQDIFNSGPWDIDFTTQWILNSSAFEKDIETIQQLEALLATLERFGLPTASIQQQLQLIKQAIPRDIDNWALDITFTPPTFVPDPDVPDFEVPEPEEPAAPVPEPSTWLLLGSGLIGMVLYRRKQLLKQA